VAQAPGRIILCQAFESLLQLIPRFSRDLQLPHGNRVIALANGPRFGPQIHHQFRGRAIELRAVLNRLVTRFLDRNIVRAAWKALDSELTL
jgi:hypothetical protein